MSRGNVSKGFLRTALAFKRSSSNNIFMIAPFNNGPVRSISPRIASCKALVGCQSPAALIKVLIKILEDLPNLIDFFFVLLFLRNFPLLNIVEWISLFSNQVTTFHYFHVTEGLVFNVPASYCGSHACTVTGSSLSTALFLWPFPVSSCRRLLSDDGVGIHRQMDLEGRRQVRGGHGHLRGGISIEMLTLIVYRNSNIFPVLFSVYMYVCNVHILHAPSLS